MMATNLLPSIFKFSKYATPSGSCMRPLTTNILPNSSTNSRNISTSNYNSNKLIPYEKAVSVVNSIKQGVSIYGNRLEILKMKAKNDIPRADLINAAYITYEEIVNSIYIDEFFNDFKMPDTFNSWFTVVELHLWLVSARLMCEHKYGFHVRDAITEAFFEDVCYRTSLLGQVASLNRKKQIAILGYQFTAAYYGYDEGVQSDDKTLAAMVWRRFFGFECYDVQHIERLVKYIRVQLDHLTFLSFHDILFQKKALFVPLKEIHVEY